MIIADPKPFWRLRAILRLSKKILVVGCDT